MAADAAASAVARNQPHSLSSAAHHCPALLQVGNSGVSFRWLRPTAIRDHTHSKLQIVVLGEDAHCLARWRMKNGRRIQEELRGAHVWLIPAGVLHGADWWREAGVIAILVDTPAARIAAGRDVRDLSVAPLHRYVAGAPLIADLCAKFWQECRSPRLDDELTLGGMGHALAGQVLRAHFAPVRKGDPQKWLLLRTSLTDVQNYVEENPAEEHSLVTLARLAHLSPSYFGQLFRAATGVPPMVYVVGVRVRHARELMRAGRYRATDVAQITGFSSQARMNQAFRQTLNALPTDFLPGAGRNRPEIENTRKRLRWHFC